VVLKANGKEVASGVVPVSAPLMFTANDCLDFAGRNRSRQHSSSSQSVSLDSGHFAQTRV
jgi:hypothetical protein